MTNLQLYLAVGLPVLFNAAARGQIAGAPNFVAQRKFSTRLKHLEER